MKFKVEKSKKKLVFGAVYIFIIFLSIISLYGIKSIAVKGGSAEFGSPYDGFFSLLWFGITLFFGLRLLSANNLFLKQVYEKDDDKFVMKKGQNLFIRSNVDSKFMLIYVTPLQDEKLESARKNVGKYAWLTYVVGIGGILLPIFSSIFLS